MKIDSEKGLFCTFIVIVMVYLKFMVFYHLVAKSFELFFFNISIIAVDFI